MSGQKSGLAPGTEQLDISVVMPVYNEAENLQHVVKEVIGVL